MSDKTNALLWTIAKVVIGFVFIVGVNYATFVYRLQRIETMFQEQKQLFEKCHEKQEREIEILKEKYERLDKENVRVTEWQKSIATQIETIKEDTSTIRLYLFEHIRNSSARGALPSAGDYLNLLPDMKGIVKGKDITDANPRTDHKLN